MTFCGGLLTVKLGWMLRGLLVGVVMLLGVSAARAQVGIYGAFSTGTVSQPNTSRMYGGTFGVYYDGKHYPGVDLGLDLRLMKLPSNSSTNTTGVLFGLRAAVRVPAVPLHFYAQGMVGDTHVTYGQGTAYYSGSGFETAYALGVDLTVLPHVDWRVLEFDEGHIFGAHTGMESVSTGLVVRLP
jgi:hypothetical protein